MCQSNSKIRTRNSWHLRENGTIALYGPMKIQTQLRAALLSSRLGRTRRMQTSIIITIKTRAIEHITSPPRPTRIQQVPEKKAARNEMAVLIELTSSSSTTCRLLSRSYRRSSRQRSRNLPFSTKTRSRCCSRWSKRRSNQWSPRRTASQLQPLMAAKPTISYCTCSQLLSCLYRSAPPRSVAITVVALKKSTKLRLW